MEDLYFKEDRAINVGPALSSMINSSAVNNIEGSSTFPILTMLKEEEENIMHTVHSDIDCALSEITENSSRVVVQKVYVKECIIAIMSNDLDTNVIANVKEQLFISYSPVPDIQSKQPTMKNLKRKTTESRASYKLRKMMLECEERRVDAINKLIEKICDHNKIQQERNDILKRFISSEMINND